MEQLIFIFQMEPIMFMFGFLSPQHQIVKQIQMLLIYHLELWQIQSIVSQQHLLFLVLSISLIKPISINGIQVFQAHQHYLLRILYLKLLLQMD